MRDAYQRRAIEEGWSEETARSEFSKGVNDLNMSCGDGEVCGVAVEYPNFYNLYRKCD